MAIPDEDSQRGRAEELRLLGNDLYRKGDISAAIPLYEEASQLARTATAPLVNLSSAYYELGQYDACIRVAHAALGLFPDTDDSPSKTKLLARMGKALRLCQKTERAVVQDIGTEQTKQKQQRARQEELQQHAAALPRFKPSS